jgi:bifunctional NMN adenylyltransferase/nudix hydrolase
MQKPFDLIVFIGRFQPFHNSHLKTIQHAYTLSNRVYIIVGSSGQARTYKNPFTEKERSTIILKSLYDCGYIIFPYENAVISGNDFYNDEIWAMEVKKNVMKVLSLHENRFYTTVKPKIGLIGHIKDGSSYYLNELFPEWELINMPMMDNLNSTDIRGLYFQPETQPENFSSFLPPPVIKFLNQFKTTQEYQMILREKKAEEDYKALYANSPFPPTFVTVDAIIQNGSKILMITRDRLPGEGLLALPGGFLDADSDPSLEHAMIREVSEEVGITIKPQYIVNTFVADKIGRSSRGRTISHVFHIILPQLIEPNPGDDARTAQWIEYRELERSQIFEDHYQLIQKALNDYETQRSY